MKYQNILNYQSDSESEINFQTIPYDKNNNYKDTNKSNVFSDNGAWHGYYLPKDNELSSFMGPLVLSQEVPVNVGPYSNKLIIKFNNKILDFKNAKINNYSLPGKLVLTYEFNDFTIVKSLIFINSRSCLIKVEIINKVDININLNITIEGAIYTKIKTKSSNYLKDDNKFWFNYFRKIKNEKDKLKIYFNPIIDNTIEEKLIIHYDRDIKEFSTNIKDNQLFYQCNFGEIIVLPKTSLSFTSFESFVFSGKELNYSFEKLDLYFEENSIRWNQYIENVLKINSSKRFDKLIIKSLQTLVGNWRSPAGVIKKNFMIPSITYQDFIGAWSWDTWKIVVGVAQFDVQLAQNCFEAMFDFQIKKNDKLRPSDVGMIPDCIFFNYSPSRGGKSLNWNERNTKPSLAAWAAKELFKISLDKTFLKRVYPKIVSYNKWWNNNRSLNKDCILEYGATIDQQNDFLKPKTIIEAAAWESGMDNAPRFDWDRITTQKCFNNKKLIGYVIDQISVDLNSFNYLEFITLQEIAEILELKIDVLKYKNNALKTQKFINDYMYNENLKFYYDIKIENKKQVVNYGKGIEGVLPLFANVASKKIGEQIIENINDKNFDSFVPFPSVALSNERFSATDYWRGPVWLDWLYFSLKGISNYHFYNLANKFARKAFKNMQGLLSDLPIRENYNPLNGDGLATTNFSWSASMILIIIKEIIIDFE